MISLLFDVFQRWYGCQINQDTLKIINLLLFCAKIRLDMNKVPKTSKNILFFALLEDFSWFFNFSWILAQKAAKFIFLMIYQYFWHLSHLWIWTNNAWKNFWAFQSVCNLYFFYSFCNWQFLILRAIFKMCARHQL